MFERLQKILSRLLVHELEEVTKEANLFEDLGADSLDYVEMVFLLEEEFDVEIADNDLDKVKTVNDILELLEKKKHA